MEFGGGDTLYPYNKTLWGDKVGNASENKHACVTFHTQNDVCKGPLESNAGRTGNK